MPHSLSDRVLLFPVPVNDGGILFEVVQPAASISHVVFMRYEAVQESGWEQTRVSASFNRYASDMKGLTDCSGRLVSD
jgi:hypothetical protein